MSYIVRLIGGPRDGEVIEGRLPPFAGTEYTTPEGSYVVLGDPEPRGAHGSLEAAAFFAPDTPPAKPNALDGEGPIGRALLGALAGLMWAGVAFTVLGMVALMGWAINALAQRVGFTNLTIALLAAGSVIGGVWGYIDAKGPTE